MRILFFNYEYPPLGGGAGNASAYILRELSRLPDLEVDFVTSSFDDQFHLEEIGANIRVHKLPIGKNKTNIHFQTQKDLLVYTWKAFFYASKLIGQNRYDLTHSFFGVPCGALSLLFWWKNKLPYIISLRGADVPGYSDRFMILYKFIQPLILLIWKKAAFVVANSQELKDLALKTKTKKEIQIIYNGVDTQIFKPDPASRNSEKFILTPGASRITARKGLNFLVEAVAQLASKYSQLRLEIMGEGNEEDNLKKLVEKLGIGDRVEFLGRIPREKTSAYYQRANTFVLPSLNEGMSNAMLEALASGLPLISTDTGGARELIKEGENGYIIKMKDSLDIAKKIEKIIQDKDLEKKMSEKSREISETMSWEKVARQYVDLYEKI